MKEKIPSVYKNYQKKMWVVFSFSAKKSWLSQLAEVEGRKHTCNGLTLVRCLSVSCRTDMSCVLPLSSLLPNVIASDETQTPDTRGTNFTTVVKLCHLPALGFPRCPHCHSLSIHFPPGPLVTMPSPAQCPQSAESGLNGLDSRYDLNLSPGPPAALPALAFCLKS